MSDLEPTKSRLPRRAREERAFRLVVASGVFGTIAVVGLVLAIVDVTSAILPILAAVVAVVCGLLFKRAVGA